MTQPSPELLAELMRELLPDPPELEPASPTAWTLEWPVEGSLAWRMMPAAEQWACRQARMPRERHDAAINSVYHASREALASDRHLDPLIWPKGGRFHD